MPGCAQDNPLYEATQHRRLGLVDRLTTWVLRTLLAAAVIALFGAAVTHAIAGRWAAAVFVAAYVLWLLSEARITVRAPTRRVAEHSTVVPYALARVAAAITAAYSPPAVSMRVSLVLAAVFTAGVTLRAWAIHELGSSYSHRLTTIPALVTDGPYRLLRHPAYAGMLLASLAFTADFLTPASIVTLTLLVAAVIWRIRVEERLLGTRADYREFASTRARMLPGVW